MWRSNADGSITGLKYWTIHSAVHVDDWNTLKVVVNGTSLKFYINGTLVWTGTSTTVLAGQVGLAMYRGAGSTGNFLNVDWAKLTVSIPDELFLDDPFEVVVPGVEVPGGTIYQSP